MKTTTLSSICFALFLGLGTLQGGCGADFGDDADTDTDEVQDVEAAARTRSCKAYYEVQGWCKDSAGKWNWANTKRIEVVFNSKNGTIWWAYDGAGNNAKKCWKNNWSTKNNYDAGNCFAAQPGTSGVSLNTLKAQALAPSNCSGWIRTRSTKKPGEHYKCDSADHSWKNIKVN